METITSKQNPKLKDLQKLAQRKHRDSSGLFMAEGEDMLEEALLRDCQPERVFYDAAQADLLGGLLAGLRPGVEQLATGAAALASVGSLGSGSRVVGVWRQDWDSLRGDQGPGDQGTIVYLHEVSDPGNVGTVIRSALAFGAGQVVLSPQTADPFSPKAVRASMGAIFGQAVARSTFESMCAARPQMRTVALAPRAGTALRHLDLGEATAIVLGAEREGLPDRIISACDEIAHVPLDPGGAESLNVAMTATLCLYESALHRLSTQERPE